MLSVNLTFIICGVLLLLAVTTPLCSVFFRRPRPTAREGTPEVKPRFSIVITVHDNSEAIQRNLPMFLEQDYDGFEVVVVDDFSADDTADQLVLMKERYPNLYTTFIPESSHYLSRRKLALTLGIKAAKYDWIVFTDIDSRPESQQWLTILARYTEEADIVCGYTSYEIDTKPYWRFRRLLTTCQTLRHPFRYEGRNLAFRRDLFLQHNGFLKNLPLLRGEYDFIVNEYGNEVRIVWMTEPEGRIRQETPSDKQWNSEQLCYMETRRHLTHAVVPRLLFNADQTLHHVCLLSCLATLVFGILATDLQAGIAAGMAIVLSYVLRTMVAARTFRDYGETLPAWRAPFMELRTVWTNLRLLLRHRHTDRYEFIRK